MATLHHIISGPSRWDLMMSIFEGKSVSFTLSDEPGHRRFSLNDDGIVRVVIKTLHEHSSEDYVLMEAPPMTGRKPVFDLRRDEPTWLIIAEYEDVSTAETPFDTALIEYNERTRSGMAVTYSEDEVIHQVGIYVADYWAEKTALVF